jgi:ubiquinone/menaquinone biosynthesis C-methylase UbiE
MSRQELSDYWYSEQYGTSYKSLAGAGHRILHRSLESGHERSTFNRVLELGAGRGDHLKFVDHGFNEYVLTDIREISPNQLQSVAEGKAGKVAFAIEDMEKLTFSDESFDRVVVTCVLPHLKNPEQALQEIRRVLKRGAGIADIYLGHDPGLFFDLAKWAGPLRAAKKSGHHAVRTLIDAREHMISAKSIARLIQHVFRADSVERFSWPIKNLPYHLSPWSTFRILRTDKIASFE